MKLRYALPERVLNALNERYSYGSLLERQFITEHLARISPSYRSDGSLSQSDVHYVEYLIAVAEVCSVLEEDFHGTYHFSIVLDQCASKSHNSAKLTAQQKIDRAKAKCIAAYLFRMNQQMNYRLDEPTPEPPSRRNLESLLFEHMERVESMLPAIRDRASNDSVIVREILRSGNSALADGWL